jgi:hypothetical protein
MRDFTDALTQEEARIELLRWRQHVRENNYRYPRCSGCGLFMPVYLVTAERMASPDYLAALDFQPGDLVCWWCVISGGDPERNNIAAGHA